MFRKHIHYQCHTQPELMIYDAVNRKIKHATHTLHILEASFNFPFPYIVTVLYLTTYRCVFGTSSKLAGVFAVTM